MFIFKIVMIGLKKVLLRKNKWRQTMHHQQLFLQAFAESYTEGSYGNSHLKGKVAFWTDAKKPFEVEKPPNISIIRCWEAREELLLKQPPVWGGRCSVRGNWALPSPRGRRCCLRWVTHQQLPVFPVRTPVTAGRKRFRCKKWGHPLLA